MVDVLETNGYAAFGSANATDALSTWIEVPDLAVISDHSRSGGGSSDLVRFIRKLRADGIPVVAACSRCAGPKLIAAGARCTIGKPISERALLVALRWLESVYLSARSGAKEPSAIRRVLPRSQAETA
ncbi:MAG TPA: hypothetical protein VF841_18575 [Anaeromyxobacter sp.]